MKFLIRTAAPQDAADIAALCAELGYASTVQQLRQRLHWVGPRATDWVGVAEQPGQPLLGWIHVAQRFALEDGHSAEILGLVAGAAARRRGVGRQLVAAAEAWSRRVGAPKLKVRSNIVRVESHVFYPALGFARSKTQHVYVKALTAVVP